MPLILNLGLLILNFHLNNNYSKNLSKALLQNSNNKASFLLKVPPFLITLINDSLDLKHLSIDTGKLNIKESLNEILNVYRKMATVA